MKLHLLVRSALSRRGAVVLGGVILTGAAGGGVALAAGSGTMLQPVTGNVAPSDVHPGRATVIPGGIPKGDSHRTTVEGTAGGSTLTAVGGAPDLSKVHPGTATPIPGVPVVEDGAGRTTTAK